MSTKKKKTSKKKASGLVTIKPPVLTRVRIGNRSVVGAKSPKNAPSAAKINANNQKHSMVALGTAGALGFLEGQGSLPPSLDVAGLGIPGTVAIGLYVAGLATKNKTLQQAATGPGAVAVYQMAKEAAQPAPGPVNAVQGADFDDYEDW